jgi:hypothetical protein
MQEFWFRYVDRHYAAMLDEFERPMGRGRSAIGLLSFPVAKHTPKGVWLHLGGGQKRFVLKDARKRYACPNIVEARTSYIERKKKQVKILTAQLETAEWLLKYALGRELPDGDLLCLNPVSVLPILPTA